MVASFAHSKSAFGLMIEGNLAAALNLLRSEVPGPGPDRWLSPELAAADQLLIDEALVPAVQAATGTLA